MTRHYDQQEKYLRLEVEGYAPGSSYTEKDWTGSKEIQRTIANKVVASAQRVLTIVTAPYVRQTIGTKELVFEKENQAVLSSDQIRVLHTWWNQLSPDLKQKIENQQAYIMIIGYTSPSGSELYNQKLGEKRALHVKNMLDSIIGKRSENKNIADIRYRSKGEVTDDPKKYVKIIIK